MNEISEAVIFSYGPSLAEGINWTQEVAEEIANSAIGKLIAGTDLRIAETRIEGNERQGHVIARFEAPSILPFPLVPPAQFNHPYRGACAVCGEETNLLCDKCRNWTCLGGATQFTVWIAGSQRTVTYCGTCSYGVGYGGSTPPIQEVGV